MMDSRTRRWKWREKRSGKLKGWKEGKRDRVVVAVYTRAR